MTPLDAGLGVVAFFTTRDGGVSLGPYASLNLSRGVGDDDAAVAENRRRVAAHAGSEIAFMSQVHGARAVAVDAPGSAPEADAMVTATPGLGLAVVVADCVPVLLAHEAGPVGVAHAGRRGLVAGIVEAAVAALRDLAGAGRIDAALGPAICGACYEVPADMRDDVARSDPSATSETSWGTPALDLPRAVEARLKAVGVDRVTRVGGCTRENLSLFSHRRDGATGRAAGVIVCGAPA